MAKNWLIPTKLLLLAEPAEEALVDSEEEEAAVEDTWVAAEAVEAIAEVTNEINY